MEDIPFVAESLVEDVIKHYTPQTIINNATYNKLTPNEYSGYVKGIQQVINDLRYWSRDEGLKE